MRKSFKFAAVLVGCVFAGIGLSSGAAFSDSSDGITELTAAEMLEDGLDAATDRAPVAARNLLEQLISTYPASPEAAKARKVLVKLEGTGSDSAYKSAVIREDQVERLKMFRHAFLIDAGDRVFFAENSASLGGRARTIIESQARWLKERAGLQVDIIGRADDGGSAEEQLSLARQRAEATRDKLVAAGVDGRRLTIKAVGSDDPLAVCKSPICQAENRNVEIFIASFDEDGDIPERRGLSGKGADLGNAQVGLGELTTR